MSDEVTTVQIPTALRVAASMVWAITPEYLTIIEDVAAGRTTPLAVTTKDGTPMVNTRSVEVRDGVAVIPVHSVIMRRASLFNDISGAAASVETIAKDFYAALNNPAVKAILFDFDSPGGSVSGISELADIIFRSRGIKPIYAYVGDLCASAAYWLACACDVIVAQKTARIGSLGVLAMADISKNPNRKRFTSTNAVNKAVPADTSKGEALIQEEIDMAETMFLDAVSNMRDIPLDTVMADFGQGGTFYAEKAKSVGMIDRLGSFEEILMGLQQDGSYQAASMTAEISKNQLLAMSNVASNLLIDNGQDKIQIRKLQI